ncbi:MAG: RNA methyltransferase [Bacteroidetes bacterium]|nr:RNA methyltransferase [Bacteroidota bacterium]
MISISKSKLIRSLDRKKYREHQKLFVVEGVKMVLELLEAGGGEVPEVTEIFASGEWIELYGESVGEGIGLNEATEQELRKVSHLVTPQQVMAIVKIPEQNLNPAILSGEIVLGLEAIRDPGNLGTIVRTADWFGIRHILCTPDSVDLYNPKVVQATMGAMARTRVYYTPLEPLLEDSSMQGKPVYGTFLGGKNIYETSLEPAPMILFGNESKGLSGQYDPHIKERLSIPSFAGEEGGSESLNLASSVAVVCSEIKRRG